MAERLQLTRDVLRGCLKAQPLRELDRRLGRSANYVARTLRGEIELTFEKVFEILTAALIRLNGENMGISLSTVETLAYVAGGAIAIFVAVFAGLGPARRAASVLPMVAMRSEYNANGAKAPINPRTGKFYSPGPLA